MASSGLNCFALLFFSSNFIFTPSFGAGYYDDGDGKKLGYNIQFRTTLEVSYQLKNENRIGLRNTYAWRVFGLFVLNMLDAYVDAQLSTFPIKRLESNNDIDSKIFGQNK